MSRVLRTLAAFLIIFILSSCDSCSNPGTTIAGNPQLPIIIGRVSAASRADISIPSRIFGETVSVLNQSSVKIYVNALLKVSDLSPEDYYNATTDAVEFTLSSIDDGDALTFVLDNSVDEYTYNGTASSEADTEATSANGNADTGNEYSFANFYGHWSREGPCDAPTGLAPNEATVDNILTLTIGGTNCNNDLGFDYDDEQPTSTTSYSVDGDNLTITNSLFGTTAIMNISFSGDIDAECVGLYQFSGWLGDEEVVFYYLDDLGSSACELELF
jgi:hypothetical protein